MRVMFVGFSEDLDLNEIKGKINNSYKDYIYFDSYEDVGEAEYMVSIRSYDLIFMRNIPENYTPYLNFFKAMKEQQFAKVVFFEKKIGLDSKKISYVNFMDIVEKIFSYIDIEYVNDGCCLNYDYVGEISNRVQSVFTSSPDRIKHIKVHYDKRAIEIFLNEKDSFMIDIPKEKDFKILIYFIRHYGEVISVDSILSGITPEPEEILTSPIETGISTIRKIFKTKTPKQIKLKNPITASKRIGYSFQVVV